MASSTPRPFVSRAGLKLAHALEVFGLDVTGRRCADFGCNVGGFTDCLLQAGAESVVAVDTGHGTLAWKLRSDPRVEVRERTNALHDAPPPGGVDLVTIDMAWTRQRLAVPAALAWLPPAATDDGDPAAGAADAAPAPAAAAAPTAAPVAAPSRRAAARIVSLVKPHYELEPAEKSERLVEGRLDPDVAADVARRTVDALEGVAVLGLERSPVTGSKSSRRGRGNIEFLALLRPT